MATYEELSALFSNDALKNKVAVACAIVAADIIAEEPGTANRRAWAKKAAANPAFAANDIYAAVLGANAELESAQIAGASEAAIKTAVENIVTAFTTD